MILNNVDNQFVFEFSFDKFILDDNNEYNNRCDLFWNDIIRRFNSSNKTIFLFNFDELKKTLRRKKLAHFSLLYLKLFEIFKLDDIKWKIINFNVMNFFRYDCDFEILFETRRDWVFIKKSNSIDYIIMLKRLSSLIDFDDDSNVKLFKIIMLLNKYIDTYFLFKNSKIRLNWWEVLFRALL